MKTRILAILLTAAMLLAIMAGCGSDGASAETAGAVNSAETAAEAAAPETESAAEPAEEETAEELEPEVIEEATEEIPALTYPVADGASLTAWVTLDPPFRQAIEDWNDLAVLDTITEATGVALEFNTVSSDVATEQFPLMIAGGDWTDFIPISYYTGGDAQAYADEVIIDLTDMLPANAPDYWAQVQQMNDVTIQSMVSGGRHLTFYAMKDEYYTISGPCIRQDWMDELGLAAPTNLDELSNALKAIYDAYRPTYTIYTSGGSLSYLSDIFGTKITGYSTTSLPVYVNENQVVCTYATDEYRAYLEWFVEMYEYGIIHNSFYELNEMDGTARNTNIAVGETAIWSSRCESIDEWETYTTDAEILATCDPEPMAYITDDGTFNWSDEQSLLYTGQMSWCVTSQCEEPELALQFLNYFFTEEGSVIANYGTEGYTWEFDKNGDVAWTEVITNNPDGYTAQLAVNVYTSSAVLPLYCYEAKMIPTYSEKAQRAFETYNQNYTDDHALPGGAAYTAEQSGELSETVNAVLTYTSEQLMKFMTCQTPLNDDTWAEFQNSMKDLGIEKCMEVYQANLDELIGG